MKRLITTFIALFFVITAYSIAQPKLEIVNGETYDWGTVTTTEGPLKAKMTLKNVGNEKLIITNVRPACGCTTAPLDKNELAPGETATLDITLRIGSSSRKLTKTISVKSNDPDNPNRIIYLKANVIALLEVKPRSYLSFKNMKVGYESASSVTLINNSDKKVKITDVKVSPENMNVNIHKGEYLKPGQKLDIVAKVKPEKSGNFGCRITIKTDHPDYPEIRISGSGRVAESEIYNN